MKVNEAFGHIVATRRKEAGLTLRQLSSKSHISLGYLSEVERGVKEASSDVLEGICYALEVPTYVLVQDAGLLLAREELTIPYGWELELDAQPLAR